MTKVDYLKPQYRYWKGDSNNKNGNKLIFPYLQILKYITSFESTLTILKKIQNFIYYILPVLKWQKNVLMSKNGEK